MAASPLQASTEIGFPVAAPTMPISLNQQVLAYIDLFQGRLHDFMETGMKRGSKYLPMIQGVLRAEGLPLDLAYVPLIESAFRTDAVSRASAAGVWQFTKGTALSNGLRRDWFIDQRSDPEKATVAAANYLKTLAELFDGDWPLALASYNSGPASVQKAIKRVGSNDFWKLADKPRVLPRETREYVPMILAAVVIARNPAQYGFAFESEEQPAFETVTFARPVDLRRVAEWAGTTVAAITALNPELRRPTTPIKDAPYRLKVPAGTSSEIERRLGESADAELVSLTWYSVKRGDTLAGVARKLGVGRTDLAEANDLRPNALLFPGQRLMVPRDTVPRDTAPRDLAPRDTTRRLAAQEETPPAAPAGRVKLLYAVRKGDTLSSVADLFKITVTSLRSWNPGLHADRLSVGQRLTVYRPATD